MSNKYKILFLILGIGIGIILTNMIYYVNPVIEYVECSEEDIISKAKDLGMVFVKNNIETNSNKEELNKAEVKKKKFTVKSGDTLDEISERLYELGLIDNAKNFCQYSTAKGVAKHLRTGNYVISSDFDYETIIKILTKEK